MSPQSACRIGLLTPGWPGQNTPNGIATSVYFLAMGLRAIGQTPVILANQIDGPCPEDIPVVTIKQVSWRWQDRVRARLGDGDAVHRYMAGTIVQAIAEASRDHGLDAVLMEETNGWAGFVQKRSPVPVFITLHGPWVLLKSHATHGSAAADRKRETRERRGYEASSGIIAPSQNVLTAVEGVTPLADKPRIVLPNAFPLETGSALAADQPSCDILFVGRFDLLKGADTVLAAFAQVSENHPQARLTFAGPGIGLRQADGTMQSAEDALAALPEAVRARITYMGPVDREEVARLRAKHAVALIASRFENLNYSLLEAMAAGQAITCTAVGGPAEVLEDGKTSLLVPPGDPEAMATALGRLLEDAQLRQQLGQAARDKLARDFAPPVIASRTVDFITGALKGETSG